MAELEKKPVKIVVNHSTVMLISPDRNTYDHRTDASDRR